MGKASIRIPMPASKRAKIFSSFDALSGLKEAIAAKERIEVPRRELAEDRIKELNEILSALYPGQLITVVYYGSYERNYLQRTGTVSKVDAYWQNLTMGNISLDFSEIDDIIIHAGQTK